MNQILENYVNICKEAIEIAKTGDLILITGKGSEQAMCVTGGKMIPWDDRLYVREFLLKK